MKNLELSKILHIATTIIVVFSILYFSYLIIKPFLLVIIIAFIFSIFLNPAYEWFLQRVKKPSIAAIITIVLMLIFILSPLIFVFVNVLAEARGLFAMIQAKPTLLADAQAVITNQMQQLGLPTEVFKFNIEQEVLRILKTVIQNATGTLFYAGSLLLNTFFVLITVYFFLIAKKRIGAYLQKIEIIPRHYYLKIQTRTTDLINGIVRGNLFVAGIQIVLGTLGFLMFGIPAPLLLGVLYGIFSLMPAIGAMLVWGPVAIILFFTHGPLVALLFAAWFVVTNFLLDNFVSPKIIGSQTKLHQLLIMFSVVGGVQQFGLVGVVLGPVIVALAFVAIEMYEEITSPKGTKEFE